MILATSDTISGKTITETFGVVTGSAVKARHVGSDILASVKNLVGGEVTQYTKLMNDTRELAVQRMRDNAAQVGANAVICVRFVTSEVMQGMVELCAYGTAVKIE